MSSTLEGVAACRGALPWVGSLGHLGRAVRVALVTCLEPPQEDFDAPPLMAALQACGHVGFLAAWNDPAIDWGAFDAALVRSTWDYFLQLDAFLAWAEGASGCTALWNPLPLLCWNTHKFYLRELESRGVAIVPTEFLPAGSACALGATLVERNWEAAIIKPAVGADSFAAVWAERAAPERGQAHLDRHLPVRDMLVQRYLPSVVEPGERCLVFIDGAYSHAVRKRSLLQGGRHTGPEGVPVEAVRDEIAAAERVLAAVPGETPLYARVDLLCDEAGARRLLELELVEPSLFFAAGPGSAARLVEALARRLRSVRRRRPG